MKRRVYTFSSGPLQATVYQTGGERKAAGADYLVDLFYAGDDRLYPRFLCTGEEAEDLHAVARAADDLVNNYLLRGATFEEWCQDRGLDPDDPDLLR